MMRECGRIDGCRSREYTSTDRARIVKFSNLVRGRFGFACQIAMKTS